MKFVGEAVRDVLGTDDPASVMEAVAGDRERTWLKVRQRYLSLNRREVPKKQPGEYVPAWFLEQRTIGLSDFTGQYFVARALLYAHRVAVVDRLAYFCDEDIMKSNENIRDNLDLWRDTPPPDMEELLARVLLYLPLEQAGLLHYLTPPPHVNIPRSADGWAVLPKTTSDENLERYFKEYLSRRGQYFQPDWNNAADARLARYAAEVELGFTAFELERVLKFYAMWHDSANLYTSAYPSYRDGIQFLMRLDGQTLFVGAPNTNSTTLDALWSLPGLSEGALRKLTVQNVLDMRDDKVFERWRTTLQAATAAYHTRNTISSGDSGFTDFLETMKRAEGDLLSRARSSRTLERALADVRDFGISVAMGAGGAGAGALLSSGDLEPALISGSVGALASQLPALANVVMDAAKGRGRVRAVERHMALFGS